MAWYKTGTVTVTNGSPTVLGSGTTFLVSVSAGDLFTIDGSHIYEVTAVNTNTSLSLGHNYAGTTASGADYLIARLSTVSLNTVDLANQVSALLTSWQVRENEYKTWSGGGALSGFRVDGTPANPAGSDPTAGYYPLTDLTGAVSYLSCPAKSAISDNPYFTGQITVAPDSVTAPSLTTNGDANTGVYFPAAGNVGITTAGTQRVNVNASGVQVTGGVSATAISAIGAATQAGNMLYVKGATSDSSANVFNAVDSSGGNLLSVRNDGFVGIKLGGAAPVSPLTVGTPLYSTGSTSLAGNQLNISDSYTNTTTGFVNSLHLVSKPNVSANSSFTYSAIYAEVEIPATSAYNYGSHMGFSSYMFHYGTGTVLSEYGCYGVVGNVSSGIVTNQFGIYGGASNYSTGSVTTQNGVKGTANNLGAGVVTASTGVISQVTMNNVSGSITAAYGVSIGSPTKAAVGITAGSIGTAYGLYIGIVQGTAKWSIYQADSTAPNCFLGNTLVGTSTPATDKLFVQGATSDSTANGLNVANSDGASLLRVRNDGFVAINSPTTAPVSPLTVGSTILSVNNSIGDQVNICSQPTSTASGFHPALHILAQPNISTNSSATFFGIHNEVLTIANSYTYNILMGYGGVVSHRGTGAVTTINGISQFVYNLATATVSSLCVATLTCNNSGGGYADRTYGVYANNLTSGASTSGNAYGVVGQAKLTGTAANGIINAIALSAGLLANPAITNLSSGSITNGYGLYIGTIQATNRWSIYSADSASPNFLAGVLQIGSSTPDSSDAALQVNSTISFNPTTDTTAPSAGGAGALPATPLGYATIYINNAARKVAYY